MLTVENLRKMGFRVKVRHTRNYTGMPKFSGSDGILVQEDVYDPYGGYTEVEVYDFAAQQAYTGKAECSKKDHYCRKLGVRIALGRALKKMGMTTTIPKRLN